MDNHYSSNESYKSENKFLDIVEECLKNNGYKVWREVVPDQQKGNRSRLRVDLIFHRKDMGYIAVEGKNVNTLRQGRKFSDAIEQIQKYEKFTYLGGKEILKWCVAVPLKSIGNKDVEREVVIFIRNFIKRRYGYYLLEYEPKSKWYSDRCTVGRMLPESITIGGENTYGRS